MLVNEKCAFARVQSSLIKLVFKLETQTYFTCMTCSV